MVNLEVDKSIKNNEVVALQQPSYGKANLRES